MQETTYSLVVSEWYAVRELLHSSRIVMLLVGVLRDGVGHALAFHNPSFLSSFLPSSMFLFLRKIYNLPASNVPKLLETLEVYFLLMSQIFWNIAPL